MKKTISSLNGGEALKNIDTIISILDFLEDYRALGMLYILRNRCCLISDFSMVETEKDEINNPGGWIVSKYLVLLGDNIDLIFSQIYHPKLVIIIEP